jgi:hypothetical protein
MARDFNGTTDRIDWTSIANLAGTAVTISGWLYLDAMAHNSYMLCINNNTATYGIILSWNTSGQFQFFRDGSTTLYRITATNFVLPTGSWVHVLATHDGVMTTATSIHLYKNGTESPTYDSTNNGAGEPSQTGVWSVGGRLQDDARNVDGRIAEVAVWNTVLSSTLITKLAAGYSPQFFPTNLIFYVPLLGTSVTDRISGTVGTPDGTSTSSAHPAPQFYSIMPPTKLDGLGNYYGGLNG